MYNAENLLRKQLEDSSTEMEVEIQKLSQRFETETSQLGEMVVQEKKSKEQLINETRNVRIPLPLLLSSLSLCEKNKQTSPPVLAFLGFPKRD